MAGQPKKRDSKIQKMGLASLNHACGEIVKAYMDTNNALSITKDDEEARQVIDNQSNEQFKSESLSKAKLALTKILNKIIRDADDMPISKASQAVVGLANYIRDIQGEPTQRIEVTKKGLSPEQWDQVLTRLPEKKAEVIQDETGQ
jgi:glycerol-3-phosphate dehydrogenase